MSDWVGVESLCRGPEQIKAVGKGLHFRLHSGFRPRSRVCRFISRIATVVEHHEQFTT